MLYFCWIFLVMLHCCVCLVCLAKSYPFPVANKDSLSHGVKVWPSRESCLSFPVFRGTWTGHLQLNSQLGILWATLWYKFGLQSHQSGMGWYFWWPLARGLGPFHCSLMEKGFSVEAPLGVDPGLRLPSFSTHWVSKALRADGVCHWLTALCPACTLIWQGTSLLLR